jgi:hypothetical protein
MIEKLRMFCMREARRHAKPVPLRRWAGKRAERRARVGKHRILT